MRKLNLLRASELAGLLKAFGLLLLVGIMVMPRAAYAQSGGEGSITGTVTDNTGAAIGGATVTATNLHDYTAAAGYLLDHGHC
jgi:hypothetical protein